VSDDLHALRAVVWGTAGATGQEFLRHAVRFPCTHNYEDAAGALKIT
jgi:hypothetical protein